MNLALNNVSNVTEHYRELGQKVEIEVVAFGPGLYMVRDDHLSRQSAHQVHERNHATPRHFRMWEYSRKHDKS